MSKITFASPLPHSSDSVVLHWRFPRPYQQYTLTGRSRAAWHTSFVVPELNLLLDAGLVVDKNRPKHIFLTHGHSDHTLLAPAFVKRSDPPDVFCPEEVREILDEYVRAKVLLNKGGVEIVSADEDGEEDEEEGDFEGNGHGGLAQKVVKETGISGQEIDDDDDPRPPHLRTHKTYGLRPGDVVPLRRLKGPVEITATAFACAHSVPCLGYVFHAATPKLKPEYRGLPGPELRDLRLGGADLTAPHRVPVFAFLGDGTAETLAAEPDWLREGVNVVITECSFLYPEHRAVAERTKHTIWEDLEPVVRKWKDTTFVVTHFSLRYSDEDVRRFFERLEGLGNVVVWC
ncbi:Nuclear ribonuclease Z [Coniochaeta hoffmannii]|uniref:Nuclear ribonuclease Z n=1 Tax=Coniochaeta hoffmannii TaxID=91930 RepID=A0AA38VBL7_9PEZI|nr:Nuclear ribonuclease Z [Coniochaeta hoffmannii]